jgi:hypothetical protein
MTDGIGFSELPQRGCPEGMHASHLPEAPGQGIADRTLLKGE